MIYPNEELAQTVLRLIEVLGTFTFAVSGIRHAAAQNFDWFGGFVCGVAVAIGGGTLRDVMLGVTPFWMTSPFFFVCTALAQVFVILCAKSLKKLDNAWFAFDTLGLALFSIAGMQKAIAMGHPMWVGVIMGCITGSAGGVVRDILLNKVPVILHKEIYAMASVAGGALYCLLIWLEVNVGVSTAITFVVISLIRFLAVKYHISLPKLHGESL